MDIVFACIGAVAAILIIIFLHEGGHFMMARLVGVKVLRFSIGFGKPICRWVSKKTGTEYTVGILPLGGYVRMYGDESDERARHDSESYFSQALWKRFLIVIAGPLVNFLLALVIIWGLFLTGIQYIAPVVGSVVHSSPAQQAGLQPKDLIVSINGEHTRSWQQVVVQIMHAVGGNSSVRLGIQHGMKGPIVEKKMALWQLNFNKTKLDPLQELGITPYYPPLKATIENVVKGSPAAKAGLLPGETVVEAGGVVVARWDQLVHEIRDNPGKTMTWLVQQAGRSTKRVIHLGQKIDGNMTYGFAGFSVAPPKWPAGMERVERYGFFTGWAPAWHRVWTLLAFKVGVLFKLVVGDLPMKVMGGPVSIFQAAGKATLAGWQVYWQFVAIISLSIGFINLLPIPGLDGGHVLYQFLELIRRRPLSLKVQQVGVVCGMLLLILFMIQVTFYDLSRLFGM
jgi:regulator of sigma E protease